MALAERFNSLLEEIRRREPAYSRIAVIGQPGAGKSTLINKLVGEKVAKTGQHTDTTKDTQEYDFPKIFQKLVDTPGYDTELFTFDKWKEKFSPQKFDVFILVFKGKLHEKDGQLFSELKKWNRERHRPLFIVRNFCEGLTEEEKNSIRQDVKKFSHGEEKIFFTDCRYKIGIEELITAISKTDFKKVWRDRIFSNFKQAKDDYLSNSNRRALSEVEDDSLIAGANGLNPIPGVDVAADIAIYWGMFSDVRICYDIDKGDATLYVLPVAKKLLELATKEGIMILLKEFASKATAKTVLKYIPFAGQAVAAVLGYKMAVYAGENYNDYCYQFAKGVMKELIDKKVAEISAEVPTLAVVKS